MVKEPDTDTELVVCHTMADADFRETLFKDAIQFIKGISRDKPDIDLLLKKMDEEILADFRKTLDSQVITDPLAIIFSMSY